MTQKPRSIWIFALFAVVSSCGEPTAPCFEDTSWLRLPSGDSATVIYRQCIDPHPITP